MESDQREVVLYPRAQRDLLRIVNRRELDRAIRGLDRRAVATWFEERNER